MTKLNMLRQMKNHTTRTKNNNCNPSTTATPMLMQGQPTWASMASQPTKPRQTSHPKPGKPMLQKPTPQGTSTDSQCLIIQVHPSISMDERPNGIDTRRKINEMLEMNEAPQDFQV